MPRTVLIVDDSPTIRDFARLFLKSLQVEVKEAEDGASDFLGKPLRGPELQELVKRLLRTAA